MSQKYEEKEVVVTLAFRPNIRDDLEVDGRGFDAMAGQPHQLVSNPYSIDGLMEPRLRDDPTRVEGRRRRLDFDSLLVQQVTNEALLENHHLVIIASHLYF